MRDGELRLPRARKLPAGLLILTAPFAAAAEPSPWVLDVNAGVPHLESAHFDVAADAVVGYAGPTLGAVGSGDLGYYDVDDSAASTTNLRERGSLEGFWTLGDAHDPLRLTLRASFGVALYSSTYAPKPGGAGSYHDEDSLMDRGTLLVGVRGRGERWSLDALAGLGIQYESYGYVTVDPLDPNLLADSDALSARGELRVAARWRVAPEAVSLRLKVDAGYFRLTRSSFLVAQGAASVANTREELTQIELGSRFFCDLDALALVGIAPAAFVGVDYVGLVGGAGSVATAVPLVGVGLFKPASY